MWAWRDVVWYGFIASTLLMMLPFAIPLTLTVYGIVWLYTWTHDPRARRNLLQVLPWHPRRVYRCSRALWSGMLDGLGGPTVAIIIAYLAAKLTRTERVQDTAVRDIKYGPQARHRLDLFVPIATQQQQQSSQGDKQEADKFPVLVIFPGYRWSKTKRARLYRPMAQTLCGDGMFVVLPKVGSTGASLEEIMGDFHQCVQWVFENAVNFGGDPNRVHLLGYGAGAHLCTMYSLVVPLKTWYAQADRMASDAQLLGSRASDQALRNWLRTIRRIPRPVAGLILVSGVFDIAAQRRYEKERCIENLSAAWKTFGGRRELEEAWSPAAIVRSLRRRTMFIPPELFARNVLLIHGKRDSTFILQQSQRLFRELCSIDVPDVNMKIYANLRRVDPSIALLAPSSALALSLLEDIRASVTPHDSMSDTDEGIADQGIADQSIADQSIPVADTVRLSAGPEAQSGDMQQFHMDRSSHRGDPSESEQLDSTSHDLATSLPKTAKVYDDYFTQSRRPADLVASTTAVQRSMPLPSIV